MSEARNHLQKSCVGAEANEENFGFGRKVEADSDIPRVTQSVANLKEEAPELTVEAAWRPHRQLAFLTGHRLFHSLSMPDLVSRLTRAGWHLCPQPQPHRPCSVCLHEHLVEKNVRLRHLRPGTEAQRSREVLPFSGTSRGQTWEAAGLESPSD